MDKAFPAMALDLTDANAFRAAIRYDPLTKKGSVLDVVRIVTGCTHDHASRNYASIVEKFPEVGQKVADLKFPGRGQRPTPVAHLSTLLEIAWLCPGSNAKQFRRTGAVTMCRALGGDLSLVEEIRARHEVITVDEQEAFLAGTGVTVAEADGQAIVSAAEESRKRKLENDMLEEKVKEAALVNYDRLMEHARAHEEQRDRLFFVDAARNSIRARFAPGVSLEAPGVLLDAGGVGEPVTLSDVAKSMGARLKRGDESRIGRAAAKLFRERHGHEPPKHSQFVDGAVRKVNSYFEKDVALLRESIRGHQQASE